MYDTFRIIWREYGRLQRPKSEVEGVELTEDYSGDVHIMSARRYCLYRPMMIVFLMVVCLVHLHSSAM